MSKTSNKSSKKTGKVTPLMKQYGELKAKHPDALLLFRVGDFYETFGQDAVTAAEILGIVLTSRNNGGSDVELAGFPYHSLDVYLPKLVRAGYRVAICEQLEKPSKEKKIVKRGVTDIVTPGISTHDHILDHKSNNYLASIHFGGLKVGVAFLDISTGEFLVGEGDGNFVDKWVRSLQPAEIVYSRNFKERYIELLAEDFYSYPLDDWIFAKDFSEDKIKSHFGVSSLKGLGLDHLESGTIAGAAILQHLENTGDQKVGHIRTVSRLDPERYVWLDRFTIRNLELLRSNSTGGLSLLDIMDHTISPMGSRLFRKWVVLPLTNLVEIRKRHDTLDFLITHSEFADLVSTQLKKIGDLERLITKVSMARVNPKEVVHLKNSLDAIAPLKDAMINSKSKYLSHLGDNLQLCEMLKDAIEKQLVAEPASIIGKGEVIAEGFNVELDELRYIIKNSKDLLVDIQKVEAENTGITNLKIGFNNVFGYYLEVTNKYKNQGLIPEHWVRKQTLTGSERYITDELKKLETKILGAEEKVVELEQRIFKDLIYSLQDFVSPIQANASILATLDCLHAFSVIAVKYNYCRPEMDDGFAIDIKEGRHPVIERQMKLDEAYVPNDVYLNNDDQQIILITGPNMSGKSAVLRQTALICLMAQMGSYVPAASASLGLMDKLFTRVGASDNISSGESTFMVEMNETASIMNNISERSLLLLDEIGRGTSTYDGISIAWSLAEFLHDNHKAHPKTLFATHYHELNDLATSHERIRNYHISTKEIDNRVHFLRKLTAGGSEHSFGIHVARMAGMPNEIVDRAEELLTHLEQKSLDRSDDDSPTMVPKSTHLQLNIFETSDEKLLALKQNLQDLDINTLSPVECLLKLKELKEMLESE